MKDELSLIVPQGSLYNDICFTVDRIVSENYFSDIYKLNNYFVPLNSKATLKVKLKNDLLSNKATYGLVTINERGNLNWVGGSYNNGFVSVEINRLGDTYVVACDSVAPRITPIKPELWGRSGEIKIRLNDNLSGVSDFRGTIDGQFALFAHDIKSSIYTYTIDPQIVVKGKKHNLVFAAKDACGNLAEYTCEFSY